MFNNLYALIFPLQISDDQLLFYLRTFRAEDIATLNNTALSIVNWRINNIVKSMIKNNEPFMSILLKTKISESQLREMINDYNFGQLSKKDPKLYSDIK
jgi:hypothetical protein